MTHLTDVELVDLVDGTLAPRAGAAPRRLRRPAERRASAIRETLSRAADAEIPEPSPLFWEHFSARVQRGGRDAESMAPSGWFGWAQSATVKWAMSGALLTLLLVAVVWRASAPRSGVARLRDLSRPPPAPVPQTPTHFDPDLDEAWALVRTVADDVARDTPASDEMRGTRSRRKALASGLARSSTRWWR